MGTGSRGSVFKLYGSAYFCGFPSLAPLPFLLLLTIDLLHFETFSAERSDLLGGPRGAEPP